MKLPEKNLSTSYIPMLACMGNAPLEATIRKVEEIIDYLAEREGEKMEVHTGREATVTTQSLPHKPVVTDTHGGGGARFGEIKTIFEATGQGGYSSDKCNICDHKEPHTHSVSNGPIKKTTPLFTEENISVGAHTKAIGSEPLAIEYRLHVYKSFDTQEAVQQAKEALLKLVK